MAAQKVKPLFTLLNHLPYD